jgi:peptide/nickel transport system ATP-binding protein
MYAGQIVEKGTADEVVLDPLHPYSRGLMGSVIVPEEGMREQKLIAIPGAPPNLKDPPAGCRFAARCKYAIPQCTKMNTIEMQELGNGRAYRCIFSEEELRKAYKNG